MIDDVVDGELDDEFEPVGDWPEHKPWVDGVVLLRTEFNPDPEKVKAVLELSSRIASEAGYMEPLGPIEGIDYEGPMYDHPKQRYG